MNAKDGKSYREMRIALLHELRHVWQRLNEPWKSMFGDGISTKTDVDVEVDAHEKQFALERILGVKAGNIRKKFEEYDSTSARYSSKLYKKANRLFKTGYEDTNHYKRRSQTEYNEEYNE